RDYTALYRTAAGIDSRFSGGVVSGCENGGPWSPAFGPNSRKAGPSKPAVASIGERQAGRRETPHPGRPVRHRLPPPRAGVSPPAVPPRLARGRVGVRHSSSLLPLRLCRRELHVPGEPADGQG